MNRRSFLAALGAAPVVAAGAVAAIAKPEAAEATFRMASGYTASGGWRSGVGLQARAGEGRAYQSAGIFFDATTAGPTRILIDADRFVTGKGRPDNFVELIQIA